MRSFFLFYAPMAPPAGERGSVAAGDAAPLAGINCAILRFIACHRLRRTQVRLHPMSALAPRLASVSAPRATSATARSPTACFASCRRFPLRGLSCHIGRSQARYSVATLLTFIVASIACFANSLCRGLRFEKKPHRGFFSLLTQQVSQGAPTKCAPFSL